MIHDTQKMWVAIWGRASEIEGPFELSDIVGPTAAALGVPEHDAERRLRFLMSELDRMPDGEQYFRMEGNAVVPLAEFAGSPKDLTSALRAYPFEV